MTGSRYQIREDEQGWYVIDTVSGEDHLRPGGPLDRTSTWRRRSDAQNAADYFATRTDGQPFFDWLRERGLD